MLDEIELAKAKVSTLVQACDAEIARLQAAFIAAQGEKDKADKAETVAWKKFAPHEGKGTEKEHDAKIAWEAASKASTVAHTKLMGIMNTIGHQEDKRKRLLDPRTVEDKVNTTRRLKALKEGNMSDTTPKEPKAPKAAKPTAKSQGVPDIYLGETGNFKPGLDARYKSDLLNAATGQPASKDALHAYEQADAVKRLEQRGWTPYLVKRQEKLDKDAAKAEKAKAEKAAAAKAAADAKAAKAAEKKSAPAAAAEISTAVAGGAMREVKADPKPGKKK